MAGRSIEAVTVWGDEILDARLLQEGGLLCLPGGERVRAPLVLTGPKMVTSGALVVHFRLASPVQQVPRQLLAIDPSAIGGLFFSMVLHGFFLTLMALAPPMPPGLGGPIAVWSPADTPRIRLAAAAHASAAAHSGRAAPNHAYEASPGALAERHATRASERQAAPATIRRARTRYGRRPREETEVTGVLGVLAALAPLSAGSGTPFDPRSAAAGGSGDGEGAGLGLGGVAFDMHGVGRGAGGHGEGTIGLGQLGAGALGAGDGSDEGGYGLGAGSLSGRSGAPISMVLCGGYRADGTRGGCGVEVRGSLSRDVVRRVIRRHRSEVRFCYEQLLARRPDAAGRVNVSFIITPNGSVPSAFVEDSELNDSQADACIAGAVRRWTFPNNDGGQTTVVSYPFVMSPAG